MKLFLTFSFVLLNIHLCKAVDIGNWGKNPNVTAMGNYLPSKLNLRPCIKGREVLPCRSYNLSIKKGPYSKVEYNLRNKCSHGDANACLEQSRLYIELNQKFGLDLKAAAFTYVELACFHGDTQACRLGAAYPEALELSIESLETHRSVNLGRLACELDYNEIFCNQFEILLDKYCNHENAYSFSYCKDRKSSHTCQTDKHFVKIGFSGDQFNYKSWKSAGDLDQKPELEIVSGNHTTSKNSPDSKCLNNKFMFNNGDYFYEVDFYGCVEDQATKGMLKVYRGEILLKEWACKK